MASARSLVAYGHRHYQSMIQPSTTSLFCSTTPHTLCTCKGAAIEFNAGNFELCRRIVQERNANAKRSQVRLE
eukprot:2447758-Amphidinium_carterae.1